MTEEQRKAKLREQDGKLRQMMSELLSKHYLSDDLAVAEHWLEDLKTDHEALHQSMDSYTQLLMHTAMEPKSDERDEMIEKIKVTMNVQEGWHIAMEYFELMVADHVARLKGERFLEQDL